MHKHSFKTKLILIMVVIVTSIVGILCLLSNTVFVKYYYNKKTQNLKTAYYQVLNYLGDDYDISDSSDEELVSYMRRIWYNYGISVVILDRNWIPQYRSQMNVDDTIRRYQDSLFGKIKNMKVLEKNDDYTISKCYDRITNMSFLEIHGILDSGNHVIMQLNVENIEDNLKTFTRFVLISGALILAMSIIVLYFVGGGVTRPLRQLSVIATNVSDLKFDQKYTGKRKDEIGTLGNSINTMSNKLETSINDLRAANIELKKDLDIIKRNDEMRREFLSNVTHELKTPIALIQGYAEGLKEGISDDPESMDYYCEVIIDEACKMNSMVQKLLTLNQLEFGNDKPEIARFNLGDVLKGVARANQLLIEKNEIRIEYSIYAGSEVWADESMIEEVITNYISNAINHCKYEKIIHISATETLDQKIRVEIFNTGDPIPEEDIDRIWEKFYKVDKARTREYGGNGIGLSIVKAILEKHNATYGAYNKENGVSFWFELACL